MKRHLICVDTETNGLDRRKHQAVEVAWHNLATDETGCFIPRHDVGQVLAAAADDVKALQINRYLDRLAAARQDDGTEVDRLWAQFTPQPGDGAACLMGSAPDFDAAMLHKLRPAWRVPWYHHLWDISVYAAGVLGLDELPRLRELAERLGVSPPDHTAAGDVAATVACYRLLQAETRRRTT